MTPPFIQIAVSHSGDSPVIVGLDAGGFVWQWKQVPQSTPGAWLYRWIKLEDQSSAP